LALKLDPQSDPATYLLAFTHKHLERPQEAIALLDRLLSRQPNDQDALFLLGQSCVQAGDRPRAARAWEKLLQLNAEHHEALYALSRLLQPTSPARAAEYRQKLASLQQSRQVAEQAEAMANFGLSAAQSRDWPRAIERLNEAITLCGDCRARADLYKNLGLTQARSGDFEQAEASLRRAREWKPGDVEIVRALEMLRTRALPR
jgi:tetratricopeptide (TPR) repeat protein